MDDAEARTSECSDQTTTTMTVRSFSRSQHGGKGVVDRLMKDVDCLEVLEQQIWSKDHPTSGP